jgi:hypothetical protein
MFLEYKTRSSQYPRTPQTVSPHRTKGPVEDHLGYQTRRIKMREIIGIISQIVNLGLLAYDSFGVCVEHTSPHSLNAANK